jgi:hypothetical protein
MTLKLYEWLAGVAALALICVGLWGWGDYHGHRVVQAQFDAYKNAQAKALSDAQAKAAVITTQVVTKYVDRVVQVKGDTQTIIKRIPANVTPKADSQCIITTGFVSVHDAAATGEVQLSTAPSVSVDSPSPLKLSDVGRVVAGNYGTCRAEYEKLTALQDWVLQQTK